LCTLDATDPDDTMSRLHREGCPGCDVSGADPFWEHIRLWARLRAIGSALVVTSVASDVAFTIARELVRRGDRVGLLYLDDAPASIPGLAGSRIVATDDGILPAEAADGLVVMSPWLLRQGGAPSSPRPCRAARASLSRLLTDVEWGPLDYLVVAMPAEGGDESDSAAEVLAEARQLVLVSTSEGGALDVRSRSGEAVSEGLAALVRASGTQGTRLAIRNHGPGTESEIQCSS